MKSTIRTMPLITSEITVINKQEVTTALTLRYTPTPLTRSLFDTYRWSIHSKHSLFVFKFAFFVIVTPFIFQVHAFGHFQSDRPHREGCPGP